MKRRTIAVDLDGTLAHYDGWKGEDHIGEPVPEMVAHVKKALAEGATIIIFTARVCECFGLYRVNKARVLIQEWCEKHLGQKFLVTAEKSPTISEFWDDRARQVIPNTGEFVG